MSGRQWLCDRAWGVQGTASRSSQAEHLMAEGEEGLNYCHFLRDYFIMPSSYTPPLKQIFSDFLPYKCLKSSLGRRWVSKVGWVGSQI